MNKLCSEFMMIWVLCVRSSFRVVRVRFVVEEEEFSFSGYCFYIRGIARVFV